MKLCKKDLLLYAVTDRSWLGNDTLYEQTEKALRGGATAIQLREKDIEDELFFDEAVKLKELCKRYNALFIINDNVELAKKIDADGVHIGQDDLGCRQARNILGNDKIIGVSAHTISLAKKAEEDGADYIGSGAVFITGTKTDAESVSISELSSICNAVSIPVVAIGGISNTNMQQLRGSGICGVALVSAIFAAENIEKATKELKNTAENLFLD